LSHSAGRRIQSIKNPSDPIENQTSDLTACIAVPQPTAPTACPLVKKYGTIISEELISLFLPVNDQLHKRINKYTSLNIGASSYRKLFYELRVY
jgi:hypothetical protein